MRSRVLVSVVGVPLILLIIFWAPAWVLAAALALLSAIAAFELTRCVTTAGEDRVLTGGAVLGALGAVWLQFQCEDWYGALLVFYTLLAFAYAVCRAGAVRLQQVLTVLFAAGALPYAFGAFLRLHDMGIHRAYLLLPLLFSFCSDTAAFFAGHAFGKHKLAPRVSPHKTVEGALGGIVGSVTGGLLFALVVNTWGDGNISYPLIALVGVLISLAAQLGDLSFSLIKREFGVKDYGHIFLAHGGVLDRFDSVIFAAPTLLVLLQLLRL